MQPRCLRWNIWQCDIKYSPARCQDIIRRSPSRQPSRPPLERSSSKLGISDMKAFVVLSMALAIASCKVVEESSKKEKRGLFDGGHGGGDSYDFGGHGDEGGEDDVKHVTTITKKVPVPYPVEVEKQVPIEVKVPFKVEIEKKIPIVVEKKVPIYVEKKIPVHVDRPVPYKVEVKVPVIEKEYIEVPQPYEVYVEKKIPVYVPKPVYIEKPLPVTLLVKKTYKKGW
ncbi:uncharacterized protein LOC109397937 [Aedes albopictus]|uniref:Uncharacterized protein n=1 Tax=Aedes albopictus TaxID=7160 RepID=A0ABM1ZVC6_AEDAL